MTKSFGVVAVGIAACSATAALADTPTAYFQLSAPSAANNAVTYYHVPVLTSAGTVVYEDVQIKFDVSASGALTLSAGYPIVTNSPALASGNFIAGRYKLAGYYYQLTGPGVGPGGRTSWSFTAEANACLQSVGWTTGVVAGHPLQTRLNAAKITYPGYAYGVLGNVTCSGSGIPSYWASSNLIGAASTSTGLTIYRYTNNSGADQSSPVDSASFQRCPATGTC